MITVEGLLFPTAFPWASVMAPAWFAMPAAEGEIGVRCATGSAALIAALLAIVQFVTYSVAPSQFVDAAARAAAQWFGVAAATQGPVVLNGSPSEIGRPLIQESAAANVAKTCVRRTGARGRRSRGRQNSLVAGQNAIIEDQRGARAR